MVALNEVRSLWNVAPIAVRPSVWKLIGRWPKSSPPGNAMFARPQRARSGPRIDDRRPHRLEQSRRRDGMQAVGASGTTTEISCSAGRVTVQPNASSSSIIIPHVGDVGHVGQVVLAGREQAGRHLLEHRVFCAVRPLLRRRARRRASRRGLSPYKYCR